MEASSLSELMTKASVSLRNSLQGVLTGMDLLSDYLSEEEAFHCAGNVLRGMYQLERTSWNLNLLFRLQRGEYSVRAEHCDLHDFWGELFERAGSLLRELGLTLDAELSPRCLSGCLDPILTEALFWNLLDNAAANAADGRLRVELSAPEAGQLLLRMENRADPAALRLPLGSAEEPAFSDALGLGLSLIREGAAAHGGSLLLSADRKGLVTALLRLDVSAEHGRDLCARTLAMHPGLDGGLVYLSRQLPARCYDPRGIFG